MAVRKKAAKKKGTKKKAVRKKNSTRKKKVTPVPEGYSAVTPSLRQKNASATIAFCQAAFGAKVKTRIDGPNGAVMHAQLKIGDALLHIGEATQGPPLVSNLLLYVKDVDKVLAKAVAAGGTVAMPLANMFWGDRFAVIQDPQGNLWEIASRFEVVATGELKKRTKAFMQAMGSGN